MHILVLHAIGLIALLLTPFVLDILAYFICKSTNGECFQLMWVIRATTSFATWFVFIVVSVSIIKFPSVYSINQKQCIRLFLFIQPYISSDPKEAVDIMDSVLGDFEAGLKMRS